MTTTAESSALADAVAQLRDARTIRERCTNLWIAAAEGQSRWFTLEPQRLGIAADIVAEVTRERYPDGRIPYHSRWRHFEVGGIDRTARLLASVADRSTAERARLMVDLAVVSVLLDAGAGADWRYREAGAESALSRSEGLGVASFDGFAAGLFSSDPAEPLRVDARALERLQVADLATMFQVGTDNPLVGLEGRTQLLRRLGRTMAQRPDWFGADGRPSGLFDRLATGTAAVRAGQILGALLETLSPIWLAGNALGGIALGDCWRHRLAGGHGQSAGWVPFHKLSQWLTYSMFEPFEYAGIAIEDRDALTGLPEYRNGGLFIDTGVLELKDASIATGLLEPGHEAVIEWRALTVCALDSIAVLVRERLGLDAKAMPLACVLEGGTWAAGRRLAARERHGLPPLSIDSDGTVF
ncbi:URC4/urg3 family protein [soil metagenome]